MILFLVGIFGACIGSFLNVLLCRMPIGEGVLVGRSHCMSCRHRLHWYELVPLVSFFVLSGQCRHCRRPISWQYPIIELVTAILFVIAAIPFVRFDSTFGVSEFVRLGLQWYAIGTLIIIFVYDFRYQLIPVPVTVAGVVVVVGTAILFSLMSISSLVFGALVGGAFFGAQYLLSRGRWLGLGDVFLGVLMGVVVGHPLIIVALFFAYVSGGLVSGFLLVLRKKKLTSRLAFGPFLAAATIVTMFYGERVLNWYMQFIR